MKYWVIIIIAGFILTSCSTENPKEELKELLNDPMYVREIRKNGFVIKVAYLPPRYFELRQMIAKGDSISSEEIEVSKEEAKQYYANGEYFLLTIAYEDQSKDIMNEQIANFPAWSENLQKFYFRLREYIYLETALEREIQLSVYDFQNTFGYTKDRKMLLCFPKEFNGKSVFSKESEFVRMHIKDWGWGIGKQNIEWPSHSYLNR